MDIKFDSTRPLINVFLLTDKDYSQALTAVLNGIEEEGIPFSVQELNETVDPVYAAYKAAESSRLGVGISVGEKIVVHYIKLKQDQPLFCIEYTQDNNRLRSMGMNAARLIKGLPFSTEV